jgi:hypothetical protein
MIIGWRGNKHVGAVAGQLDGIWLACQINYAANSLPPVGRWERDSYDLGHMRLRCLLYLQLLPDAHRVAAGACRPNLPFWSVGALTDLRTRLRVSTYCYLTVHRMIPAPTRARPGAR